MTTSPETAPSVLFVCVHNAGKSQMAAALAGQLAGEVLEIRSARTAPEATISHEAAAVIPEMGADMSGGQPKPINPQLLRTADRVIILGTDAQVAMPEGAQGCLERWVTDEPSERGIKGTERMGLIRDDINHRITDLITERSPSSTT